MLLNTEDYAIPFSTDDQYIECQPDIDHGDPSEWPHWTDSGRWELGPELDDPAAVALREIRHIGTYVGDDANVPCCQRLELCALVLEQTIERLRNDPPGPDDQAWLAANPILPPISGGSPDVDPEPFEPSDQDWDDLFAASYGPGDDDLQAAGLPCG
jgi:hypothetical protein